MLATRPLPTSLRPSRLARTLLLAFSTPLTGVAFAQSGLTDMGLLNGGLYTNACGVSADGSVVVGYGPDGAAGNTLRAFRWTQSGGMVSLGTLNGGSMSSASGISADGSTIVGVAADGAAAGAQRAFRWTQAGGMVSLGVLNGGVYSYAMAVNGDGSVVVGYGDGTVSGLSLHAFRWTQAGGMVDLGGLNGGLSSYAYGVSADGSVVVGQASDGAAAGAQRAFRWTQATGMVSLGTLNSGSGVSVAYGVNADGSVVVGYAPDGAIGNTQRAFRWTQTGGMVSLGTLAGNSTSLSSANAVSANGKVVVGYSDNGANGAAFRWTQATGMQSVENWLRAAGVTVAKDITQEAFGVNADGSVVVGTTQNSTAFIARVAPAGSGLGSGLVTLADVQNSLAGTAGGGQLALTTAGTLINGAHSRPLARRVAAGENTFWLAGDWGTDDHGTRSGNLGLAEVGFGKNFGPMQVNLSLGQTWAKQNQVLNGSTTTDGTYLLAEALIPVTGKLWATLGAYSQMGRTEMKRGYLNAGLQDYSHASPDTQTRGLRARLDLDQVARVADVAFSPYVDLTYSESRLAAYTETGGSFAARFDSRKDQATELRIGAHADKGLANGMNLFGTLEAAHRFEASGAHASGQVLGLFGFSLPGQANKQDWLRAGIGLEGKLGEGRASLSLNATTEGSAPNLWLAASWQRSF